MSKVIQQISPHELQAWSVPPNSKIDYYDGKLLIVSDAEPEAPFGIAAKAGISALFGIAVFTHAPLVGMVCAAYAAYKVTETVRGLYGSATMPKSCSNRLVKALSPPYNPRTVSVTL